MRQRYQAIALGFTDQSIESPPILCAKGRDGVAETIMAIARKHGIPVVERQQFASALEELPIDSPIPAKLFKAAAALLTEVGALVR